MESSRARGNIPHAPAATTAAGRERAADDESSSAEVGAATGYVVFESPRIDMLTMRGKVRIKSSDQTSAPCPDGV